MSRMSLGRRLRQRLDDKGLAVSDLAQACGVSPQAVYQWFNGDTKGLKPENLVAASDLLQTHIRWLVLALGPKERGSKLTDLTPEQAELLHAYIRLTPGEQRAIMATVANLLKKASKRKSQ